jgi:hypothetical protein
VKFVEPALFLVGQVTLLSSSPCCFTLSMKYGWAIKIVVAPSDRIRFMASRTGLVSVDELLRVSREGQNSDSPPLQYCLPDFRRFRDAIPVRALRLLWII